MYIGDTKRGSHGLQSVCVAQQRYKSRSASIELNRKYVNSAILTIKMLKSYRKKVY